MEFGTFIKSDSGAVTVDWVVLTAGVVGLGLATLAIASSGVENLSLDIRNALANSEVAEQAQAVAEGVWGTLSMLHFDSAAAAEQEVARVLPQYYDNDPQAYYDSIQESWATAMESGMVNTAGYEADVLGALTAYAQRQNITLNTGENPSYSDVHAATTAALQPT